MKNRISEPVVLAAAFLAVLAGIVGRAHLLQREETVPVVIQEAIVSDDVSPERDRRLSAVIETKDDILAIDSVSLLQATRAERKWRPVETPEGMSLAGRFVLPRPGAKRIYFYPTRSDHVMVIDDLSTGTTRSVTRTEARELTGKQKYGLWAGDPSGRTWERFRDDFDFDHVVETAGGLLYALASAHDAAEKKLRVLRSKDGGRTWDDITHNAMDLGVGRPLDLFLDPDDPERVCIRFQGMRIYVAWTEDDRFLWSAAREVSWNRNHSPPGPNFFATNFYYSGIENISDYELPATRGNYFQYPFGNRTSIEPFELTLDRTAYEFSRDAAKIVTATIRFRRADHAAAIMDLRGSLDFWGLKIEDSTGYRTTILPLAQRQVNERTTDQEYLRTQKEYEARPGLLKTELIAGKAYVRKVDLGRITDFPKPGVYKVQLIYACPFWAGEGRVHWTGSFGGPVATIHIK